MNKTNKKTTQDKSIILFNQKSVRRYWDEDKELWYFSVVDVVAVLVESKDPKDYWYRVKKRLSDEEKVEVSTICRQLKLLSADKKMRLTDCATTEGIFRIIQSIPSPKAELFKVWLAKVGYQRIKEIEDPELAFNRAMQTYLKKGYSKEWINQRLKTIEVRKALTDEWDDRGVKGFEYAILTNDITKSWSDQSIKSYKKLKGLKKQNLRDNMSNLELVLNMLAEASTTEISKKKKPVNLKENRKVAKQGGGVAKKARLEIEKQTGESVVKEMKLIDKLD